MDISTLHTLLTNAHKSPLWLALFIEEFHTWRSNAALDDRHSLDVEALDAFVASNGLLQRSPTLSFAAFPVIFELAASRINSLDASRAIAAVRMALALASHHKAVNEQRRAHNILSALQLCAGDPHSALRNALSAATIARELNNSETLVNALLNTTLALTHIGLFKEAIDIAMRADANFCRDPSCAADIALLLGNAAHAASTTGEHTVALMFAKRALALMPASTDSNAIAKVNILTTQLKSSIDLREASTVDASMCAIRNLAKLWPSQRMDLCHRFCEALHTGFSLHAYSFVLAELAIVRELARDHHDLFLEASHQLIQLSLNLGDDSGVLLHVNHLVSAVGPSQLANVEAKLSEIRLLLGPPQPSFLPDLSDGRQVELPSIEARELVQRMAVASEISEDATGKSVFRVGRLSGLLAYETGSTSFEATVLEHAARLHDIGKLTLPTSLIARPHRLSAPEYEAMQRHADAGFNFLKQCAHPFFEYAAEIARFHHENWEGTGYPSQLAGEAIPRSARIVALCETYDSYTHARSYRARHTHAEAVAYISSCSGTHFDPTMTRAFLAMIEKLHLQHGENLDAYLVETSNYEAIDDASSACRSSLAPLVSPSLIEASDACAFS